LKDTAVGYIKESLKDMPRKEGMRMRLLKILRVAITNCILVLLGIADAHNKTGASKGKNAKKDSADAAKEDADGKAKEAAKSESDSAGSTGSAVGGTGNSIPSKKLDELPQNVQDSYNNYDKAGWPQGSVPGQTPGTGSGGTYKNDPTKNSGITLPSTDGAGNSISYYEHDVNNKIPGQRRDDQRFVHGTDGSTYYTDSHYGDKASPTGLADFVKIIL